MKGKIKILRAFLILLVMLSNVNWAVSSSYCEMTKSTQCECRVKRSHSEDSVPGESLSSYNSCCIKILNLIQNDSEFETLSKISGSVTIAVCLSALLISEPSESGLLSSSKLPSVHYEPVDLRVHHSSLLI